MIVIALCVLRCDKHSLLKGTYLWPFNTTVLWNYRNVLIFILTSTVTFLVVANFGLTVLVYSPIILIINASL